MTERRPADDLKQGVDRRAFLRGFAGQASSEAGRIVGAVSVVRAAALGAVGNLGRLAEERPGEPQEDAEAARTLVLRDQRFDSATAPELVLADGAAVATALRSGAMLFGPVLGIAAAYGLAGTGRSVRHMAVRDGASVVRSTSRLLIQARPTSAAVWFAMETVASSLDGALDDATALAERTHAAAIGVEVALVEAIERSGTRLAEILRSLCPTDGASTVVIHGSLGAPAGGAGFLAAVTTQLADCSMLVAEGQPSGVGRHLTFPDIRTTRDAIVVSDLEAASALAHGSVAALVVGAEAILTSGDVLAPVGTLPLAAIARSAHVPVVAVALAAWRRDVPVGSDQRLSSPILRLDVTPAEIVSVVVTDELEPRAVPR